MKLSEATKGLMLIKATEFSPATLRIYKWALNSLGEFLSDPDIKKITDQDKSER